MSLPLPQFLRRRPTLAAVILTVAFAGIGYGLRYGWVEPEAIGDMCRSAQAVWWCPLRTGLIVATEWKGVGYLSVAFALLSLAPPYRQAMIFAFIAMAIGGAGLVLYNATIAGPGLLIAMLRLAWIESRHP